MARAAKDDELFLNTGDEETKQPKGHAEVFGAMRERVKAQQDAKRKRNEARDKAALKAAGK